MTPPLCPTCGRRGSERINRGDMTGLLDCLDLFHLAADYGPMLLEVIREMANDYERWDKQNQHEPLVMACIRTIHLRLRSILAALAAALRKAYELGVREAAQEAVEAFQALKLHNDDDGTASIVSDFSTFMRAVDALQGLQEILATLPLPADVAELLGRVEG